MRNIPLTPVGIYSVDIYTDGALKHEYPENSYQVDSLVELAKIVHNCSRKQAGIRQIRITVNKPHEEPSLKTF
jgi:hypothetical protein